MSRAGLPQIKMAQREALGPRVAALLREAIAGGDLRGGARLVEAEVAETFGVSRGPVRDAFRILQAEGLVESHQRGVVVTGIAPDDINELYSLRMAIESLAVRRVIERGEASAIPRLRRCIEAMREAAEVNDTARFGQADIDFHNAICALSGHRRLTDVWEQYREVMMMLLRLTVLLKQDLKASTEKHRILLDLIEARDAAGAEAELANHLEGSRMRMVQVWEHLLEKRGEASHKR